jgi:hypothetical protein
MLTEAAQELRATDTIRYVSEGEETTLNSSLRLSAEDVEDLLTQEVLSSASRLHLLVKKPDYLVSILKLSRAKFQAVETSNASGDGAFAA